jgi:hypothetical protein
MKTTIEKYLRKIVNEISKQKQGKSDPMSETINNKNLVHIQELTTKFNELKKI